MTWHADRVRAASVVVADWVSAVHGVASTGAHRRVSDARDIGSCVQVADSDHGKITSRWVPLRGQRVGANHGLLVGIRTIHLGRPLRLVPGTGHVLGIAALTP